MSKEKNTNFPKKSTDSYLAMFRFDASPAESQSCESAYHWQAARFRQNSFSPTLDRFKDELIALFLMKNVRKERKQGRGNDDGE